MESDIELQACEKIDFVRHHAKQCNISPYGCPDRDRSDYNAAMKFVSGHIAGFGFSSPAKWPGPPIEPRHLEGAWEYIESTLDRRMRNLSFGHITVEPSLTLHLVHSKGAIWAESFVSRQALGVLLLNCLWT